MASRRPLTYDDRPQVENGLNRGDRLSKIAQTLGRTQQTVAAEVRRNWTAEPRGRLVQEHRNVCARARDCDRRRLCDSSCPDPCWRCRGYKCNSICPDFAPDECPRHHEAPYTCDSCPRRMGAGCTHPYRFHGAAYAQDLADRRRRESREGVDMGPEAFAAAAAAMREGLALGQSPEHVLAANPSIPWSKST